MLEPINRFLEKDPQAAVTRGFGQMWGIHPGIAFLTLILDMMLFGGEVVTGGISLLISVAVAFVLAVITFLAQRKWYDDDSESALIKALILGLLTAIPTALPAVIYVPSGVVGLVHNLRKGNSND
jgi:hypothetical protein